MQKNFGNFSMEEAMEFAKSPHGQKLISMLQNSQDPGLKKAMEQASSGNMDGAKASLQNILQNPEVQKILGQSGR